MLWEGVGDEKESGYEYIPIFFVHPASHGGADEE